MWCIFWVDANLIKALIRSTELVERFRDHIELYSKIDQKPEDILRRFSLNGDNKLDFKEFQPALKRLFGADMSHTQSKELFLAFCPTSGKKLGTPRISMTTAFFFLVSKIIQTILLHKYRYWHLLPNHEPLGCHGKKFPGANWTTSTFVQPVAGDIRR